MVNVKNNKPFDSKMDQYKKMNCPRCSTILIRKRMRKIKHPSGAVVDVCDSCGGMWLDKNEVNLLYHFSRKVKKNEK